MIEMDGHGAYVWAAVVVSLLAMFFLVMKPLISQRAVVEEIFVELEREQRLKTNQSEIG
jgi:heme exporter protein CcmD